MKGFCLWLTGLPAAGKTTLAQALEVELVSRGRTVTLLDGDGALRQLLSAGLGFTKNDRHQNVLRASFVTSEIVKHGGVGICALISPYTEDRRQARAMVGRTFVEIFLDTPQHVCEFRDPKGLYARARAGDLEAFTGVNDPYERPVMPELHLSGDEPIQTNVRAVLKYLETRGLLQSKNKPTALLIGRFQPFHEGHRQLFLKALEAEGYVAIGVRNTHGFANSPYSFEEVKHRIDECLADYSDQYEILRFPNITNVVYGRAVGYKITRFELESEIEAISGTTIRKAADQLRPKEQVNAVLPDSIVLFETAD